MAEIWKDVVGYEEMYQISDQGRVKGLDRKDSRGNSVKERILAIPFDSNGYPRMHLSKNNITRTFTVHRMVVRLFLLDYSEDREVDHIDGVKSNNKLSNLRMVTQSQNLANMRKRKGTSSIFKGVCWHKKHNKWYAGVTSKNKQVYIGSFSDEAKAAKEYDKKAIELFGVFAKTNESMGLFNEPLG